MIAQENHCKWPNVFFDRKINQEIGFDVLLRSHSTAVFNVPHSYQCKREFKIVLVKEQPK